MTASRQPSIRGTTAPIIRGILANMVVESLFFGFTLAYVFVHLGFDATLCLFAAQGLGLALGYCLGLTVMAAGERACSRALQGFSMAGAFAMVAAVNAPVWALAPLLVAASVAVGAAFSAKHWHELKCTSGAQREAYLYWIQGAAIAIRVGGMGLSAGVLWMYQEDMKLFLTGANVLAFALLLMAGPIHGPTRPHGPLRPWQSLQCARYWKSAPFFLMEAGSSALRTLVGLTGVLTVVGAPSSYSLTEAFVGTVAAATAAWLVTRPTLGPSLSRLRVGLTLVAVAWLSLAGALLHWPALLLVYLVCSAMAAPVVGACYSGLVMKSMEDFSGNLQSSMLARELLLLSARTLALALAWALTTWLPDPTTRMLVVLGLTVALLPLEYACARGLATRPSSSSIEVHGLLADAPPVMAGRAAAGSNRSGCAMAP